MRGRYLCPEYRRRWLSEFSKFPLDNPKYSRYYFSRDLPFWHYPPFCRYGYVCKQCYQIRILWEHCCQSDFEVIYQQVISSNLQLKLF